MKSTGSPPPSTWRSSRRGRGVAHAIAATLTGSLPTQAIIFFFLWAEKSLRRARKEKRRSESVDDVESGERSPQ